MKSSLGSFSVIEPSQIEEIFTYIKLTERGSAEMACTSGAGPSKRGRGDRAPSGQIESQVGMRLPKLWDLIAPV
jgi:hypothetical protein